VLIAFLAFGALTQARADVLPPRSAESEQVKSALRPSSGATVHPLRRWTRPAGARERAVPRLLRTARRPVALARTAAGRVRHLRPAHRLGLPRRLERPVTELRETAQGDLPGSSGRQDGGSCHPAPVDPLGRGPTPPSHRTVPHVAAAAPAVRGHPHRPVTGFGRVTPPSPRLRPSGTIAHRSRPRAERLALAAPVPAPVSGSGECDGSGTKTSSGTGDAPRITMPAPGLWTIAPQPAATASRIIADKPSFSPD
jgi:hypothetical protein